MSKKCKAREAVLEELDFIHSMTHNLSDYVKKEDWPVEVWKAKAKMLKGVQNTIIDFLKDVDDGSDAIDLDE